MTSAFEVNFDGLVGPTHNYAGLSFGNVASSSHGGLASSPRQAALQGLEKMRALQQLGLKQGVLPPHERPHLPTLERLGFAGQDVGKILQRVAAEAPALLAIVSSASSMWVANAATVTPYPDSSDGKTHLTPANLSSMLHRAIEVDTTSRVLEAIFQGADYRHHPALPAADSFADEGAANHTRFCRDYGGPGIELFVYGRSAAGRAEQPSRFPARQTREASAAIARLHRLADRAVFAQQHPQAIDAGVFHNDVIAVGNRALLFYHELAFLDGPGTRVELDAAAVRHLDRPLDYIEVPKAAVSLEDAVASYLFNSQLISVPATQGVSIVVPAECRERPAVYRYLQSLQADNPLVERVIYFDLRQSMNNGGGPACLRLRVVLNQTQIDTLGASVILDEALYQRLKEWINLHYRDRLAPADLRDPALVAESRAALDELTQILGLGSIYDFQTV